jgi:endonuclease-8
MAEGDTILRAARRIDAALTGQTITVSAPNPRGRAARIERLDGRRLDAVDPYGKNLLLHFGDLVLHSHMGMNGSWHVCPRGGPWRRPRGAAWAVLAGAEQEAVQFGGSTLRLVSTAGLPRNPQLARLGPDVLAPELELDAAIRGLRAEPGRAIGDALLDQTLVAGIGNIFKSEACFAARVDPWRRVGDLTDEELATVLFTARELMLQAVTGGRRAFAVYRARRPCPVCGGRVASRGQGDANRTTYWCPHCQS